MKAISFYIAALAVLICANFSSQDSGELKQICSGKITYYGDSKHDDIVDIKLGSSKGSSSNAGIKFYMIPKRKDIKVDNLAYDELKLNQISSITVLGNVEKEMTRIEKRDFVNVSAIVHLQDSGTKTIKYMLPEDTKIYGRKKGTGAKGRYPISSVSKLEVEACIEEGAPLDLDKLCKKHEEKAAVAPTA
ncbi:hypothetical protein A3F06_00145 [candidate division TM6 bacterium RIFCSPHIGHO2_12_FULL_36_22]|nr:MAG: hypothetical protein A3F06_00145 [candidate division TM6 bacterium RIFCSPHIGHO2_12_FULL_36_22]